MFGASVKCTVADLIYRCLLAALHERDDAGFPESVRCE